MNMIFWRNPPGTRDFVRAEGIPPRGAFGMTPGVVRRTLGREQSLFAFPAVVGVLAKRHQQPGREQKYNVIPNKIHLRK